METFRQLTEADLDAYYFVLHEGYKSNDQYGVDFTAGQASKEETKDWLNNHPTYGLFVDGELATSITLRMPWGVQPGPTGYPHIGHFVTNPNFKHQGYAKKILKLLESQILTDELKTNKVTLGTADTHPWLKDMYLKMGFSIFKTVQLPGKKHKTIFFEKNVSV